MTNEEEARARELGRQVTPRHPKEGTRLPVRPLQNPLTTEDEATLDRAIEKTTVHHDLIQRAKEAGLEVGELEQRNAMHHHVASTLKRLFFPTHLTPPQE